MLWPVSCPVCGEAGELLCGPCLRRLIGPQFPRCLWCGETLPCKVHGRGTPQIRAGALYEGSVKELILMLKYGKYEALGPRLGRALGEFLPRPDVDVLVPVPLHLKSKRRYNQATAIARGLGAAWRIDVLEAARWTIDVPARAGLGAAERLALSSGAFALSENISALRVGFVDDVATTGVTLSSLAAAARAAGAYVAGAFVIAHVPPV